MPEHEQPFLSVIVPATDSPPTLERCLVALAGSAQPPDELVVVSEPANLGPAAARNLGARRSRGEVVAFVDSDVEVDPDALTLLRRAFRDDPRLAATFGAYDDRPAAPGAVSRFRNLLHHHVHCTSAGPAETFWAGLGAVRRRDFDRAGGFDAERFPEPSIEDIELGLRLRRAGAAIVLDPSIRGRHLKRWTLASMVRTDLTRRGIPWARLQLEVGGHSAALNLAWRQRLAALASLAALAAAATRRPLAAAAALAAVAGLNAPFYALLRRRGGLRLAALGLPLHVTHHLVAVAAALLATGAHLREGRR